MVQPAAAQSYKFTKIVDTNTPVPGRNGETFFGFGPPIISDGKVIINTSVGSFVSQPGTELEKIVDTHTIAPESPPSEPNKFTQVGVADVSEGEFLISGLWTPQSSDFPEEGIYTTTTGSALVTLVT